PRRLLAGCFPEVQVVGIDRSRAFVAAASASDVPATDFRVGDVTAALPIVAADVIYARFLLSHLPDTGRLIDAWCAALAPGGMLVLEEPERIVTADEHFARYLELCAGLMAHHGGELYRGPSLASAPDPRGAVRIVDGVVALDAPAGRAAAMFWRNLRAWARDEFVTATCTRAELDALARRLEERTGDPSYGVIDWALRQVVFE